MAKQRKQAAQARRDDEAVYTVFVSHATADKWIAVKMCEDIAGCGANFFRDDRDIDSGDDIPEAIREAIIGCNEFVVLLSPASIARDWVRLELGAAWGLKKHITVVLHHMDADPLPETFKPRKATALNDFEQYLNALRRRIASGGR